MRIFGNVYMGKMAGSGKVGIGRILEQRWKGFLKLKSTHGHANRTRIIYMNMCLFMLFIHVDSP